MPPARTGRWPRGGLVAPELSFGDGDAAGTDTARPLAGLPARRGASDPPGIVSYRVIYSVLWLSHVFDNRAQHSANKASKMHHHGPQDGPTPRWGNVSPENVDFWLVAASNGFLVLVSRRFLMHVGTLPSDVFEGAHNGPFLALAGCPGRPAGPLARAFFRVMFGTRLFFYPYRFLSRFWAQNTPT